MKRILTFLLAVVAAVCVASDGTPQERYVAKYAETAISEMHRTGVPASITLAQGLLESRAGLSELAAKGNNHFGIKCHRDWKGKTMNVDDDRKGECFRVYDDAIDSYRDHSDFLRYRDRYKSLFNLDPKDYKGWAAGLKAAGYATDPSYAQKLVKLIEDYQLYRYDEGVVEVPETPESLEEAVEVTAETSSPAVRQFRESHRFQSRRPAFEKNGVLFVVSYEGETYASIAESYGLYEKELLGYNELKKAEPLMPGTTVYIQAKAKKAASGVEKYIVGEDSETLRDICQRFAVRMKSVIKMNKLPKDYVPSEGDTIVLR